MDLWRHGAGARARPGRLLHQRRVGWSGRPPSVPDRGALHTTPQQAAAVGVDVRLAGSSALYSNDLQTTYPLYAGGAGRTVVKVPLGQVSRPITLLRLRVLGTSPASAPSLSVRRARVLQYVAGKIVVRRTPTLQVVAEFGPAGRAGDGRVDFGGRAAFIASSQLLAAIAARSSKKCVVLCESMTVHDPLRAHRKPDWASSSPSWASSSLS